MPLRSLLNHSISDVSVLIIYQIVNLNNPPKIAVRVIIDVTGWVVAVTDGDTIKDLDGGIDRCFFKVTRSIFYPYSLHQEKPHHYSEEYI